MRLTPLRLMLAALVAGVVVMGVGSWLGGRCAEQPSATKTYRLRGSGRDLFIEPWAGPALRCFPWAFAACGLTFIGAVLWLARIENRDDRA